ncbi:MAG: hypothetical protein ACPGOV_10385 [Magnetovibrionaceae bacterium]
MDIQNEKPAALEQAVVDRLTELAKAGQWDEIEKICRPLAEAEHVSAEIYYLLGLAAFQRSNYADMLTFARAAVDSNAMVSECADLTAVAFGLVGDMNNALFYAKLGGAVPSAEPFKTWKPVEFPTVQATFADVQEAPLLARGMLELSVGNLDKAAHWFHQAIAVDNADLQAYLGLVQCLNLQESFFESCDVLRAARHSLPDNVQIAAELGSALAALGEYDRSLAVHQAVREMGAPDPQLERDALFDLMSTPGTTQAQIAEAMKSWGERHGVPGAALSSPTKPVEKPRLTVGYVLGRRRARQVGQLLSGIMAHHNFSEWRVVGFGDGTLTDDVNTPFQKACEVWHDTRDMDPYTFGAIVTSEGVDILIDASGLTTPGIYGAFASRLAPVQIAWAGAEDASIFDATDVVLGDAGMDPDGAKVGPLTPSLLKTGFVLCEKPAPAPDSAPTEDAAPLTFGVDATLAELVPATVSLFAEVLGKVPDASLVLRDHGFHAPAQVDRLISLFGDHGVSHRIDVISAETDDQFLAETDVCLVPLGSRRLEIPLVAMAQGKPVVALQGPVRSARVVDSLLMAIAPETCPPVADRAAYVSSAVQWASDADRRAAVKAPLSQAVQDSSLFAADKRATELEALYKDLWQKAIS